MRKQPTAEEGSPPPNPQHALPRALSPAEPLASCSPQPAAPSSLVTADPLRPHVLLSGAQPAGGNHKPHTHRHHLIAVKSPECKHRPQLDHYTEHRPVVANKG